MSAGLPRVFDPFRLAEEGSRLAGDLAVAQMARLLALCHGPQGAVHIALALARGPRGSAVLQGRIEANLVLSCQRCLGSLPWAVQTEVHLRFVPPGSVAEGEVTEADSEAVECVPPVALVDVVEDELLLALPMAPTHEQGACVAMAGGAVKYNV